MTRRCAACARLTDAPNECGVCGRCMRPVSFDEARDGLPEMDSHFDRENEAFLLADDVREMRCLE